MKSQNLAVPATLIAAGFFAAPGQAAITVDITASDGGTAIHVTGSTFAEYFFHDNFSAPGETAIQAAFLSGNQVGPVSATPYYPTTTTPSMMKTQTTTGTDGYYGLRFSTGGTDYTGYALVDNGGTHISELDYAVVAVPEPASWAMMILGLGATGAALRHRRKAAVSAAAA